MIWPLAIEVTSTPAIIGVSARPAVVGLTAFTTCRYIGMKVTEPNMREADDKADSAGNDEDPVAEQMQRQDRLGAPALHDDEAGEPRDRSRRQAKGLRRTPGEDVAAEAGEEDQRGQRDRQKGRAADVDGRPAPRLGAVNARPIIATAIRPSGRLT